MSKIIIGLVGPIASGKDVSKKFIEDNYGANSHRFSTMLRDILQRLYLDINRENMQNLSFDIRQRFGEDIMAKVIATDLKNDQHEIVIIDGVRRMADISKLKNFPNFYLISIDAKPKIRYNRLVKRQENIDDNNKTFSQFISDSQAESEKEIPIVMAKAQYKIDNNSSLEALYKQLKDIMKEIINK